MMKFVFIALTLSRLASSAGAASAPPTNLIAGTMASSDWPGRNLYNCHATDGISFFQRAAPTAADRTPPALIGFPGLTVTNNRGIPIFSTAGLVRLKFTGAKYGEAVPDYDGQIGAMPSKESVQFVNYEQTWSPSSSTLTVSFAFHFKNCTLPVRALFRAAP